MSLRIKKEKLTFYSLDNNSLKKIHIYEGGVSAGFPSPAEDYLDLDLNLHEYLVKHPAATFFIIAKGHSMENAGIGDNDILVVDKSLDVKNNDIVVAAVNGEFTVKRYLNINGKILLRAESKLNNYPDINIDESIDFEVWGVVTYTIHNHR
ncbi:MAG: translesion error-prone DNA polymerase V autoproteolytic subunit [Candidatus Pelagibacter sp. TMED153]|nr:MAG: translesion error-prone DNA polymerase V autoproteolytic subunit [Candidatus Pelagibacter sp. TMED153]|tara:strand:+ start:945 stop:1397 length:453 start_codon:yes stop_codon:yes gene_type:complete